LYGLHRSARYWYSCLWGVLHEELAMGACDVHHAVFFCIRGTSVIIIVAHVGDLTVVASTVNMMKLVKKQLLQAVG
ncbi:hypothetical protein M378DRAFT_90281, partial [Amanita muscaria Koide BX008]